MTINEVIERQQRLRPDDLDDLVKAEWLLSLDGQLRADFIQRHILTAGEILPPPVTSFPEDGDKLLLIQAPWDRVYVLYLIAQIDFHNGETDRHTNSAAEYNAALGEWKRYYHRTHEPVPSGQYKVM